MFKLHERLDQDCLLVGQFELCLLLINRDANYPWLIHSAKYDEYVAAAQHSLGRQY